jgi:hypothetical protein
VPEPRIVFGWAFACGDSSTSGHYNIFILGYSDYWQSALSRRIAEMCKIVPIDPNANLVRACRPARQG